MIPDFQFQRSRMESVGLTHAFQKQRGCHLVRINTEVVRVWFEIPASRSPLFLSCAINAIFFHPPNPHPLPLSSSTRSSFVPVIVFFAQLGRSGKHFASDRVLATRAAELLDPCSRIPHRDISPEAQVKTHFIDRLGP